MKGTVTKELVREVANLKVLIDANPRFDYASRAEIARRARAIVREACTISRGRPGDSGAAETHRDAVDLFRRAVAAAYPPAFWEDLKHLKGRNPAGLTTAVTFLEADPWFFRSGYTKAEPDRRDPSRRTPEGPRGSVAASRPGRR